LILIIDIKPKLGQSEKDTIEAVMDALHSLHADYEVEGIMVPWETIRQGSEAPRRAR
jgi:hypothetical protein